MEPLRVLNGDNFLWEKFTLGGVFSVTRPYFGDDVDPQRLAELLDRHSTALALYASQWTHTADDVVQEAFVRLVSTQPTPERPVPWLYAVVRNLSHSHRRADGRRRRREAFVARFVTEQPDLEAVWEIADVLELLTAETREIIVAHIWGGLTFAEIAELVGMSSSAVHRSYQSGLALLRKKLDQPCSKNPM